MPNVVDQIPIGVNLDPEEPSGGSLGGDYVPGGHDVLYSKYTDGRVYASTRPSLIGYQSPPEGEPRGGGRGLFYWESAGLLITVFRDTIYSGIYGIELATLTSLKDPVYWAEFSSTELVMTDPESNTVWLITNTGGTLSAADITGTVQADLISEGIAGGVVVLDNYCFIMSKAGKIYNSNVGDLGTWDALNFLTTERAVDPGVFLAKQEEHIIAISSSSIEIFYDAANAVASPLRRRDDVSYLVGAVDYKQVHTNGERVYFIGSSRLGSFSIYELKDLQLNQISHQSIDAWLNNTLLTFQRDFIVASGAVGEHYLVYITSVEAVDDYYHPISTAVYDASTQIWGRFETEITQVTNYEHSFPIMAVSERLGSTEVGQSLMLIEGTLAVYGLESKGQDSIGQGPYVTLDGTDTGEDLYWNPGYVESLGGTLAWNIDPAVITEEWDGGTYTYKFMNRMSVAGRVRPTGADSTGKITMEYTDDTYHTWSSKRSTDALERWQFTRLGKTKRRAFRIGYEGSDHVRFERVEVSVNASEFA